MSAGKLRIEIQSPNVPSLAVEGGGHIATRAGFTPQPELSAAIRGGGQIDARTVQAGTVAAAINGGGDIFVHARQALTAAIKGGGLIGYAGRPQVTSAISGGGAVRSIQ